MLPEFRHEAAGHGGSARKMNRSVAAHHNRRTVLGLIAVRGPISQLEIARHTQLQRSTVFYILRDLRAAGLVQDAGPVVSGRAGPRETPVEIAPRAAWAAGLHLTNGVSKLVVVNGNGHIIAQQAFSPGLALPELLDELPGRIDDLRMRLRLAPDRWAGLAVCLPGIIDAAHGVVRNSRSLGLRNFPLREQLLARMDCALLIERNAVCGAYAEIQLGGWADCSHMVYLSARTERTATGDAPRFSYGLAATQNGQICRGGNASFGELSGQPLPTAQPTRAASRAPAFSRKLGAVVGGLINLFDPRLFVLSGGAEFFRCVDLEELRRAATKVTVPFEGRAIEIVASTLGPDGIVQGAALLALHRGLERRLAELQEPTATAATAPR